METTPTSELIAEGRALVRSLALRIFRNLPVRVDLEDLIAYGELGLAEAARDFDGELGNQFSTFAYYRIRGAIYDGIAKMTWTSRARYRRLRYEQMANQVLENERERNEQTSERSESNINWFARTTETLAVVYLASGVDSETDPIAQAQDPSDGPLDKILHREASEKLRNLVTKLPPLECRLIQLVYFEGYTLQDAAASLGYSKSWASRLHAKILEGLASSMRRMGIHD
ncbi:MAG: sigma-70 family RNA polymerase sigma factor [Pirellula sp.]